MFNFLSSLLSHLDSASKDSQESATLSIKAMRAALLPMVYGPYSSAVSIWYWEVWCYICELNNAAACQDTDLRKASKRLSRLQLMVDVVKNQS